MEKPSCADLVDRHRDAQDQDRPGALRAGSKRCTLAAKCGIKLEKCDESARHDLVQRDRRALHSPRAARHGLPYATSRGLHSTAAIILCLSASLECRTALADEPLPRSVLVIDQFELASAGSAAVLSSFRSTLKSNSTSPISIYIENLDLGRFGGLRLQACRTGLFPREISRHADRHRHAHRVGGT